VKLFDVSFSRPSDLVKELDTVFKSYALSEKTSPVHFIPVDRINVLIAVAPNPGIFPKVQEWIDKLDIEVKAQAGEVSTYVYRLKYARAATTAWPSPRCIPATSTLSSDWPPWRRPIRSDKTAAAVAASAE
jgi:general secretion pathway protein D